MSRGITDLLEQLISPPGSFLLLIVVGLLMLRRNGKAGVVLASSGVVMMYVASMPFTAMWILGFIEPQSSITEAELLSPRAEAIVILGAGRREDAPEFNLPNKRGDTLSASGLERIRYGAWLAKRMNLPILVTGGLADDDGPAEAVMMKQSIEDEYGISVRWIETESRNTYENAQFSKQILNADGINSIYLVTHAVHMPRSVWAFKQFEMEVHPAPTAYKGDRELTVKFKSFLPSARALEKVAAVFHEVVGMVWYRLRY